MSQTTASPTKNTNNPPKHNHHEGEEEDAGSLSSVMEGKLRLLQRHGLSNGPSDGGAISATRNETRANVRRRLTFLLKDSLVPELSPVQNAVKLLLQLKEKLALEKVCFFSFYPLTFLLLFSLCMSSTRSLDRRSRD